MKILSHSQINMFSSCGKKYQFHYNERLRERVTSGALLFGSALDQTVNQINIDKKNNTLRPMDLYKALFKTNWTKQPINKEEVNLVDSLQIAYAESDFDLDLLTEEEIEFLFHKYVTDKTDNKLESVKKYYADSSFVKKKVGIENLSEKPAKFINNANWLSMLHKGELMVEAYFREVLPRIKEIIDVQKKVELKNEQGDTVIGFLDLVADLGDGPRILDLKTSARAYDENAANVSPQLAVYAYATNEEYNTRKTGFIVMNKAVRKNRVKICSKCNHNGSESRAKTCDLIIESKRCAGAWNETISPEIKVDFVLGEVNELFQEHVIDNYEAILKSIANESFYRNWNACNDYGRPCPYFSMCHKGTDNKLIKV